MKLTGATIELIIKGGGLVLAAIAMYFFFIFATNHVEHNTEAVNELKEASIMETAAINNLVDVVEEVKDNNQDMTRAIDRFSYLIESIINDK